MKHADAFKIEASEYGVSVKCEFCGVGIMRLDNGRPWRQVAAVVKNHTCPQLRAALDAPPVLVGQATLSNELGLCNSAYRPVASGPHVVLCSGHHPLDSETHSGGGYVWHDMGAENYA